MLLENLRFNAGETAKTDDERAEFADALAEAIHTNARVGPLSGDPYRLAGELKMPPWRVQKAQKQARRWSRDTVATAMGIVAALNALPALLAEVRAARSAPSPSLAAALDAYGRAYCRAAHLDTQARYDQHFVNCERCVDGALCADGEALDLASASHPAPPIATVIAGWRLDRMELERLRRLTQPPEFLKTEL